MSVKRYCDVCGNDMKDSQWRLTESNPWRTTVTFPNSDMDVCHTCILDLKALKKSNERT